MFWKKKASQGVAKQPEELIEVVYFGGDDRREIRFTFDIERYFDAGPLRQPLDLYQTASSEEALLRYLIEITDAIGTVTGLKDNHPPYMLYGSSSEVFLLYLLPNFGMPARIVSFIDEGSRIYVEYVIFLCNPIYMPVNAGRYIKEYAVPKDAEKEFRSSILEIMERRVSEADGRTYTGFFRKGTDYLRSDLPSEMRFIN